MKKGLYIHIPFCASKCPYCDFFSVKYNRSSAEKYIRRLTDEMKKYSGEFDTVYFGGGTPSILDSKSIGAIIDEAKAIYNIDQNSEITIECNPSKNLEKDFDDYADFGVNRISIGMQSARNEERFALGRRADKTRVVKTIADAKKAGITNISLDVMLATPGQTLSSLDETFEFIEQSGVTHISAYMLKIEKGTKFYELRQKLDLPDEDTACEMYLKAVKELEKMGFKQYEISNFAKPGYESRHNLKYWQLCEYLGLGASAHSFLNGRRFYYDKNFHIIDEGAGGNDEEKIMLGLRLNSGIDKNLIKKDCQAFINQGYMRENGAKISLTPKGMLVSNYIISELI